MVDTLHGWESRNLDLMSSRRWAQTGLSLEWFRANQIRKARRRFVEGGGEHIEYLVLQQIWSYKEKIFDKKRNKKTDRMMRNILTHANLELREQRSICARILDPKTQDRMKRRRAGVVHTTWDNLMMKWNGTQTWWEFSNDWKKLREDGRGYVHKNPGKRRGQNEEERFFFDWERKSSKQS